MPGHKKNLNLSAMNWKPFEYVERDRITKSALFALLHVAVINLDQPSAWTVIIGSWNLIMRNTHTVLLAMAILKF